MRVGRSGRTPRWAGRAQPCRSTSTRGRGWTRTPSSLRETVRSAGCGLARRSRVRRGWARWLRTPRLGRLISGRALGRFLGGDRVPAPDGPVVRAAVFLAFEVEARDGAEDVEPGAGVSSDFDLSLDRSERVEGLIKEVAHHTGLRLIAGGADVADAEVVVHAHVALDEAGDLPFMSLSIVAFEDQDVASAGGSGDRDGQGCCRWRRGGFVHRWTQRCERGRRDVPLPRRFPDRTA